MKIIEGSEDKYEPGTPEHIAWLDGREALMIFGYEGAIAASSEEFPHPHQEKLRAAWIDGVKDEQIWSKDSTGR